jgi:hypothetical protein
MRRVLFLAGLSMVVIFIIGCGSESSAPESTAAKTGISGTVKYSGDKSGGILIYATNQLPKPGEPPQPSAMNNFSGASGEFSWDLPAGTYYINAFMAIERQPQGPPQANEPSVSCNPVVLKADEQVNVDVILTDQDAGGKEKTCLGG